MIGKDRAKQIWREADAVCFDVDSTLVTDEGPFELSAFCGKAKEIIELYTKSSNEDFQSNFEKGLNIVAPTLTKVKEFVIKRGVKLSPGARVAPTLTQVKEFVVKRGVKLSPGASEVVDLLHKRGCKVYLASNSFERLIEPVAEQLNIPTENIFANQLLFDENENYSGYNKDRPTCKTSGKKLVAEILKQSCKTLVFIGDDLTDMESRPPADCFIGYGGNVSRGKVRDNSDWFVTNFQELIDELKTE